MDFVSSFISSAAEVATDFGQVLVNAVNSITSLLWTTGTDGGELTIIGGGLALALGVGAVYLIFRMVRGLVKTNVRG